MSNLNTPTSHRGGRTSRRILRPPRLRRLSTAAVSAAAVACLASACAERVAASPAWCEAIGELDATIGSIGRPDPDTIRSAFSALDGAATTIAERAPRKVRAAAVRIEGAIDAAGTTGEPTIFDPANTPAMAEVHAYAAEECRYEQVSVVASDYEFSGIPAEVTAGKVALAFENRSGREDHEIVLFVKSDGVDDPMVDLLSLPEDEAMSMARPVAFTMAGPGERSGLILDLEPGNYAAVCFVPVGGDEQGEPHFAHGMITDFVVG